MLITIVGKNSFLAQHFKSNLPYEADWRFISHNEIEEQSDWLRKSEVVVNFAFSRNLMTHEYSEDQDIDYKIAKIIKNSSATYIMLSSRKVYGTYSYPVILKEDMDCKPDSPYGRNKLKIENNLAGLLGDRLLILRLSNIFGPEHGRNSFFGIASRSLKSGNEITYDFDPDVGRDFLSIWKFSRNLGEIIKLRKHGVYNLGAGFAIACRMIAELMIKEHGAGALKVSESRKFDYFTLDMSKTNKDFYLDPYTLEEFKKDCLTAFRNSI